MAEEVGLVDVELGPIIWERTHVFSFAEFSGQHEKFFLVRMSTSEINPSFSDEELLAEASDGVALVDSSRDPEARDERSPPAVGALLAALIWRGPPSEVIDTGV